MNITERPSEAMRIANTPMPPKAKDTPKCWYIWIIQKSTYWIDNVIINGIENLTNQSIISIILRWSCGEDMSRDSTAGLIDR